MERSAILKGLWYPEDRKELDRIVRPDLFRRGNSTDAVLPHAGLFYSGRIIREYFSSLSEKIRRVFILSPSHYYPLPENRLTTSRFTSSSTPYGSIRTVPVSIESSVISDEAVQREHGIEMFLPFIRKKNLSVSYALISSFRSIDDIEYYASLLSSSLTEDTAVIASSDFTHYGLRFGYCPYEDDALRRVSEFDLKAAGEMIEGNLEKLFLLQKRSTICGIAAGMLLSLMMKSMGKKGYVRDHYTSYDILRDDPEDFVSYVGIIWE